MRQSGTKLEEMTNAYVTRKQQTDRILLVAGSSHKLGLGRIFGWAFVIPAFVVAVSGGSVFTAQLL